MGIDMDTISSRIRFRPVADEESTVRQLVAEILAAGYYDDQDLYRVGDPSAANSWASLFAGFRQLLLPAEENDTFVSLGNDDVHYPVNYLWEALAPFLVDGSYYAYLEDFRKLHVLMVLDGQLVTASVPVPVTDQSAIQEGTELLKTVIEGVTPVPATPVVPEWFADHQVRATVISDLAAGDLLPLFYPAQ